MTRLHRSGFLITALVLSLAFPVGASAQLIMQEEERPLLLPSAEAKAKRAKAETPPYRLRQQLPPPPSRARAVLDAQYAAQGKMPPMQAEEADRIYEGYLESVGKKEGISNSMNGD